MWVLIVTIFFSDGIPMNFKFTDIQSFELCQETGDFIVSDPDILKEIGDPEATIEWSCEEQQ